MSIRRNSLVFTQSLIKTVTVSYVIVALYDMKYTSRNYMWLIKFGGFILEYINDMYIIP